MSMVFFLPACLASGLSYDDCSVCVIEIIPKNKSHQLPAHHSQDGKVRPTTARQEQKAQQLPALTKVGLAPGGRRGVGNSAHLMASCKQEQAIISPQSPCPFNSAKYSLVVKSPTCAIRMSQQTLSRLAYRAYDLKGVNEPLYSVVSSIK